MKTCAAFLAFALGLICAMPASASDIRIYSGTRKRQTFTSMNYAAETFRTYLVIDQTTKQFTFVTYFTKTRSHFESTETADVLATVPNSPAITKDTRRFMYASSSDSSVPVNTFRFRSGGKPALLPIATDNPQLTARTFSYTGLFYAFAAYNYEESATFVYQKRLTMLANDGNKNLTGAVDLVLDDLRARKLID